MDLFLYILSVLPAMVIGITISPNGNSPELKMAGGMTTDVQEGFVPFSPKQERNVTRHSGDKNRPRKIDNSMLAINERYRRLIPYMTFYYANDNLETTTVEPTNAANVEVEKAHLLEATIPTREGKNIAQTAYRNIPRYQGNRLTQYNIASSISPKIIEDIFPNRQLLPKPIQNFNSQTIIEQNFPPGLGRFVQKPNVRVQGPPSHLPFRKPTTNLFHSDDNSNVQYYYTGKDQSETFKLIPFQQTPIQFVTENILNTLRTLKRQQNAQILAPKEQVYVKQRPERPSAFIPQTIIRDAPVTVTEHYFQKTQSKVNYELKTPPIVETGFKPIIPDISFQTTESTYVNTTPRPSYENRIPNPPIVFETATAIPKSPTQFSKPNYYQYAIGNPQKPEVSRDSSTLNDILNILQKSQTISEPITRDNVGSSIRTLLQILNMLKAAPINEIDVHEIPKLSTPKPFLPQHKVVVQVDPEPVQEVTPGFQPSPDFKQEPYLAPVNPPSQHLDVSDYSTGKVTSQKFPLPIKSDDDGGTPGHAGVDYPTLTTIPQTSFDCKTQRYKGFFADPETRCQVWHYCDLNGGQASFLCPNGTIFSQAGLTCDWWFNVRCASTPQLYVLNESLYKYILPQKPKFPEDYSGPLVDKYLTLKFREMEEQFRKNKNKQATSEKMDESDGDESSVDNAAGMSESNEADESDVSAVSEASVIVQNPGMSGNVERLRDDN